MANKNGKKRASSVGEDSGSEGNNSDIEMSNGNSNNNNKRNGNPRETMEIDDDSDEGGNNGGRNGNDDEEEEEEEEEEVTPEEMLTQKRDTRAGYRKLEEEVNNARQHLLDTSVESMSKQIEQANLLFANVQAPSEAVLDSRVLIAASDAGALKARALKLDANAFDTDDFLLKLVRFMGGRMGGPGGKGVKEGEELKWDKVGRVLAANSLRVPVMDLMLGPLSIGVKAKKARVQRAAFKPDATQRTQATEVKHDDIEKDAVETTKMVKTMSDILEEKLDNVAIPYLKFVINPDSFAQTIENIFYFAFLIKEGKVALEIETDEESEHFGDAVVFACEAPDAADVASGGVRQQMILEFTMDIWRDAIEAYDITESMIPTRATEVVAAMGAHTWK